MTRHLSIDIETYSSINIKLSGLYKYVQSPDFQILLFAWSFDFGPVYIADLAQGESLPHEVIQALNDPLVIKHAYNGAFEWYCLNKFWRSPLEQWRCTMVHGLYCGYPSGLSKIGEAMGLPQDKRKLGAGGALIRTFCVPKEPKPANGNRTRILPHHEPEKWELFKGYCVGDVVAEMEILRRLMAFPMPEQEWHLWLLDQQINTYGVACDVDMVDGALTIVNAVTGALMEEAVLLTGLENPKSGQQLLKWLQEETGEEIDNVRKDTVSKLLSKMDEGKTKRMLEIRQELAKTSVKKYNAMQNAVCSDGRIRGLFQFYGANRTGRWGGRMVQPQNLPRNYLEPLGYARQLVKGKKVDMLKFVYGNVPDTLSQLLRTALVAPEGKVLLVADFSAIEARVLAWLAGEQWRLDVFQGHGKIYEASASQMFGIPLDQIDKELRQKGKVAELALGYQGGSPALINTGALDMGLTEEELPEIVNRWRNANRRIVDFWYALGNAAVEVMQTGCPVGVRGLVLSREAHPATKQDFFTVRLPSGRKLYYARPSLQPNNFGRDALHYWGVGQQSGKWVQLSTYGGKLTENVVQAIARDCLAVSLVRLAQGGYRIVMHVHDEVVIEADSPDKLEHVLDIMGWPIDWAPGLPLKAAGFECDFYQKD